jgi:TRAP-type C4-dicarboxylate transport system substrate-binding protein
MTILRPALLAACMLFSAFSAQAQDKIRLTMGTQADNNMSIGKGLASVFTPAIEKYSGGKLQIEVRGGGALCSEQACVEQMKLGQVDIATVSSGNVGSFGTTFDLINLPYIFKDNASAERIFNGWLVKELGERAEKELKMHMIALIPVGGFRNIDSARKEIRVPADLKGMKIRVTKSPTEFNLVKSWGAAPIPYDWSQLYEGLQSGVVDGMYLQDTFTVSGKFTEVVKYVTQVNAAYSAHPILMDLERYRKLPDWARDAIDKAGADLMQQAFAIDINWQQTAAVAVKAKARVYVPNPQEMLLWHKGAIAAWVSVGGTFDPKLARRILQEQGQTDLIKELEAAKAL